MRLFPASQDASVPAELLHITPCAQVTLLELAVPSWMSPCRKLGEPLAMPGTDTPPASKLEQERVVAKP